MTASPSLDLAAAAADAGASVALVDAEGEATSWSALHGRAAALGSRVANELSRADVAPDALVAFVARLEPAIFTLIHALVATGRPFLPIHPRLVPGEVEALVATLGPCHLLEEGWIASAYAEAVLRPGISGTSRVVEDGEATLAVLASSGTTGRPKGVVLSRRAFAASARASHTNLPLGRDDRWIATMPLGHAGGLSILTRALAARAAVILAPRLGVEALAAAIDRDAASHLSVVPTMLRGLADAGAFAHLRRLRAVLVGGAACPDALLAGARASGVVALATYGLTEACTQVTTQPRADHARIPDGDSGLPLAGADLEIRGDADEVLAPGVEGAIHVRGPMLFSGYRGEATRAPVAWLATGDHGVVREDGRLVVLARRTDLVVTGGENVYPAEVEAALRAIPGVRDCVVIGAPDARWGEVVGAVLELAPGVALASVVASAASSLAPHKRPRRAVVAREPLPRTAKGEVDRARARATYVAALAGATLSSAARTD